MKKHNWIVVDEDNNWLASWSELTEKEVQEEILQQRIENPDIFRNITIFAYCIVNKIFEPEITIH